MATANCLLAQNSSKRAGSNFPQIIAIFYGDRFVPGFIKDSELIPFQVGKEVMK
jgi:hypothetical protein